MTSADVPTGPDTAESEAPAGDDRSDRDRVDELLALWAAEYPDRDTEPMGVLLRIARLNRDLSRALSDAVASVAKSLDRGTFAILLLLRVSGPPYQRPPRWLADLMQVYPNHLSNLLDRLEDGGLIERVRQEADRRQVMVCLTPRGKEAIELAFDEHFRTEQELVTPLSRDDLQTLNRLLRRLVIHFEGPSGSGPRRPKSADAD